MDEGAKAIAMDIETGEYFSEARTWYNKVFISELKPYVTMHIIGYAALFITVIMCLNLYAVFPLVNKVNVIASVNDTVKFFPKLVELSQRNKTTRQVVVESLISKYIRSREGYSPDRFKINYTFLLKSSSKEIFDSYYKHISSKAPDSPLTFYLDSQVARVKIIKIESDPNANKATLIFDKDIFDTYGAFQSSARLQAEIEFYLSDYDFDTSTDAKLDFIVTKYIVNKVEKP
jgi:type IV secretion system protein VirB8